MPIFARTKLVIHDDCLAPVRGGPLPGVPYIILNYTGPNPQNLYHKIKELLISVWKVEASEVQERDFSWDRSRGEEKFRVTFDMIKDKDNFSFVQVIVRLEGEAKPSREFGKEGTATIRVEGRLRTEYPQDTLWQRSLLYEMARVFYHRVIYEERRKKYLEECRTDITKFLSEIKSFLAILSKPT
ncbi:MAG: hypothetical protein QMD12_02215 [Candidatus Aenigmarchaeota archaeon]|nr:hypothetical protein [Candidatus Aenigmarchaeota archaeon]